MWRYLLILCMPWSAKGNLILSLGLLSAMILTSYPITQMGKVYAWYLYSPILSFFLGESVLSSPCMSNFSKLTGYLNIGKKYFCGFCNARHRMNEDTTFANTLMVRSCAITDHFMAILSQTAISGSCSYNVYFLVNTEV